MSEQTRVRVAERGAPEDGADAAGERRDALARLRAELLAAVAERVLAVERDVAERARGVDREFADVRARLAGHWVTSFGFFLLVLLLAGAVATAAAVCLWLLCQPPGRAPEGGAAGAAVVGVLAGVALATILFTRWDQETKGGSR